MRTKAIKKEKKGLSNTGKRTKPAEDKKRSSMSLFDDAPDEAKPLTKTKVKRAPAKNGSPAKKPLKKSAAVKKTVQKSETNRKKNGDNILHGGSADTAGNGDNRSKRKVHTQSDKQSERSVKRQPDSLEKSERAVKAADKPEKDKSGNNRKPVKTADKIAANDRKKAGADNRDKQDIKAQGGSRQKKSGDPVNVTKRRLERERKQFCRETIRPYVQLQKKPAETNDEFLMEIEIEGEKMLVSTGSVDKNNVYRSGLDSEFLMHRFKLKK